jgi:hypothetical protein
MFDSYDVINKEFVEKSQIFGNEIYTENSVKQMLKKIKEIYNEDQIFEEKEDSFKVHVYYGNDLFFYVNKLNVVENI